MKILGVSAVSVKADDGWVPIAQVAVEEGGLVDIHRIESSDAGLRLGTREEANRFAIQLARDWTSRTRAQS